MTIFVSFPLDPCFIDEVITGSVIISFLPEMLFSLYVVLVAQLRLTLCNPMNWILPAPLSMEFSKQEY